MQGLLEIIFGHYGDKVGRKKTLVMALVSMGVSSTLIGLLPTYAMIGVAAPILLTTAFAQGLAIGGQWGGVVCYRKRPQSKRILWSFCSSRSSVGVILAN